MTLSPQSPPPLLQIVQERLNPDAEQAYGKIEEQLARLCGRMNCPNRYLALASIALPRETQHWKSLTSEPIDMMATFRPDLSDASPWLIGELRFAAILETGAPTKTSGAAYQVLDGRAFVFTAASSSAEAGQLASTLGCGARVFEVKPQWSFPCDVWVVRNPELWKR